MLRYNGIRYEIKTRNLKKWRFIFFITIGHFSEFGLEKIVFDFFCKVLPGKKMDFKKTSKYVNLQIS